MNKCTHIHYFLKCRNSFWDYVAWIYLSYGLRLSTCIFVAYKWTLYLSLLMERFHLIVWEVANFIFRIHTGTLISKLKKANIRLHMNLCLEIRGWLFSICWGIAWCRLLAILQFNMAMAQNIDVLIDAIPLLWLTICSWLFL